MKRGLLFLSLFTLFSFDGLNSPASKATGYSTDDQDSFQVTFNPCPEFYSCVNTQSGNKEYRQVQPPLEYSVMQKWSAIELMKDIFADFKIQTIDEVEQLYLHGMVKMERWGYIIHLDVEVLFAEDNKIHLKITSRAPLIDLGRSKVFYKQMKNRFDSKKDKF